MTEETFTNFNYLVAMTPNKKRTWAIRLYQSEYALPIEGLYRYAEFYGTIDAALDAVEKLKSKVGFDVGLLQLSRSSKPAVALALNGLDLAKHYSRLGGIAHEAGAPRHGIEDARDRGFLLIRLLVEAGFGLIELPHDERKQG